jgi:hypothetical protein
MTINVLIDDAIAKFEAERGVAANVIFLGRRQVAALQAALPACDGGPVSGEQTVCRPSYNDIAIEDVDADSHLSVDRLTGSEWPVGG